MYIRTYLFPSPPSCPPARFCDTNTTVNLKCLEFLSSLFALLIKGRFRMSDFEAAAFLPFLVIKVCACVQQRIGEVGVIVCCEYACVTLM